MKLWETIVCSWGVVHHSVGFLGCRASSGRVRILKNRSSYSWAHLRGAIFVGRPLGKAQSSGARWNWVHAPTAGISRRCAPESWGRGAREVGSFGRNEPSCPVLQEPEGEDSISPLHLSHQQGLSGLNSTWVWLSFSPVFFSIFQPVPLLVRPFCEQFRPNATGSARSAASYCRRPKGHEGRGDPPKAEWAHEQTGRWSSVCFQALKK